MSKVKEYFKLTTYVIFHPADGFYSMKYEKQGKVGIIFINLLLFWLSFTFQKQYAGFAMNETHPLDINILVDFATVVGMFLLWCVGNWSVTTLMNGEGSFKDIAMATSYAMTPVILIFIPATIISNVMVFSEKEFYFLVISLAIVWAVLLLFMGIYTVHNYTVGKAVATIILTIIAILIITFLIGLMLSLVQQMYGFVESIYMEIAYRI